MRRFRFSLSTFPLSYRIQSWSPLSVLRHCFVHTQCKLVVVDAERADRLEPTACDLSVDATGAGFLVIEAHKGKGHWNGMRTWNEVLDGYQGPLDAITEDPAVVPEDNASILFTSGRLPGLAPSDLVLTPNVQGQPVFPRGC